MPQNQSLPDESPAPKNRTVQYHFDVYDQPPHRQLLAWRERMSLITDVVPSLAQIEQPFRASIDRWALDELLFCVCYTDQLTQHRSIARISQDNARSIAFHIFLEGDPECVIARPASRHGTPLGVGILALDLDQPVHAVRRACRHVAIFVPRERLQNVFADPGAVHGRVLAPHQPAVQLIVARLVALYENIRHMSADDAHRSLSATVDLITAAFGEQAGLSGSKRAIARAIEFDSARRFVRANLADGDLSPERVLESLELSRPTIYRLFQHEGGLGAYIRHLRLRTAAKDLVRHPGIPVKDIAYSLGFESASDFTRAFRRAYGIAPQEVRLYKGWRLGERLPGVDEGPWPTDADWDWVSLHLKGDGLESDQ